MKKPNITKLIERAEQLVSELNTIIAENLQGTRTVFTRLSLNGHDYYMHNDTMIITKEMTQSDGFESIESEVTLNLRGSHSPLLYGMLSKEPETFAVCTEIEIPQAYSKEMQRRKLGPLQEPDTSPVVLIKDILYSSN